MIARHLQYIGCDTSRIFADEPSKVGETEFSDGLYPNAAGYAIWVAALNPLPRPQRCQLPASDRVGKSFLATIFWC